MSVLAHRPRDGLSIFWRESRHVALGQLWELVPATALSIQEGSWGSGTAWGQSPDPAAGSCYVTC